MKSSKAQTLANLMQDARQYLAYLNTDENIRPDFEQLEHYLIKLAPQIRDPNASQDLLIIVARLYFESLRYQEAAEVLQRVENPIYNEMRTCIDFFSAYYSTIHDWAARQAEIWEAFSVLAPGLTERLDLRLEVMMDLKDRWDACFPTDFFMLAPPDRADSGKIFLGSPHGIHSLVPMLYLLRHAPLSVRSRWKLLLDEPNAGLDEGNVRGQVIRNRDILVRIVPNTASAVGGKVDLLVWHPVLDRQAARGDGDSALVYAKQMINTCLSLSTLVFYVGQIALAEEEPAAGSALPLTSLQEWFQQKHMLLDIPPEQILERRRRSFTRTPAEISRPRADIVRGETCMPELEEIYFLRDGKGMAAFQRYGVGYWFLTIPKAVCGEDFQSFLKQLEKQVHKEQMDKVFFTGWAEGTRNCYIDFLSMDSIPMLHTLDTYFQTLPGGEDIRICSFYWNAPLRTANYTRESDRFNEVYYRAGFNPALIPPPKDLVSAADRAALEKAFRETQWAKLDGILQPRKVQEASADKDSASSPYAKARAALREATNYILTCNAAGTPYDYVNLNRWLATALPQDGAPDANETFCNALSMVLMSAERYREGAKWCSRCAPSDAQLVQLYTCDIGSDYPNTLYALELRRQDFWKFFGTVESDVQQFLSGGGGPDTMTALSERLDILFPAAEFSIQPAQNGKKNTILTGLPDGILTLPAMLYLTSHYPGNVGKRWNIAISGDCVLGETVPVFGEPVPAEDVMISLSESGGKTSLTIWHPQLADAARSSPLEAWHAAARLVNSALPMSARLLAVSAITVAQTEPVNTFPLPELQQQMRDRGLLPDISLDTLLSRRRYTFTRQSKKTDRPRDDIVRGETCMPELEFIHQRIYEDGQFILERYGIHALSLMIPNALVEGDPAQFLQKLRTYITLAEGDKVFFTGWARGKKYLYLDLITMHGRSLLVRLNEYALSRPDGKRLLLCAFYWNSTPRPWIIADAKKSQMPDQESQLLSFAKAHKVPDLPVPDDKTAAAFKASFHPEFTLADFCAPKAAAVPAAQNVSVGKKKLSKAQRKAQANKNNNKKKR